MSAALLNEIYYNASNPASYGGVAKLVKASGLPKKEVAEWLKTQWTHTLHQPMRKTFDRRRYITRGLDYQFQADLVEMQPFSKQNRGMRYLLTVIDVFSRYAWARPLKTKTGKDITLAFKSIFDKSKRIPRLIQTDQGLEFENRIFRSYLNNLGVELFSVKSPHKAALVERFNRTLKTRMWRVFTKQGNHKWLDILPRLVDSYNKSVHRIVGQTPASVTKDNETRIWTRMYATGDKAVTSTRRDRKTRFKLGQRVRLSRQKNIFEKSYTPNWTEEEFIIHSVNTKYIPTTYKVRSLTGEIIEGGFYNQELQEVTNTDEMYRVEKIIRTKGRGVYKQALIKWMGYKEPSWIPYSQLERVENVPH